MATSTKDHNENLSLSIIVPTFNDWDRVKNLIFSYEESYQTRINSELIIIDNNSDTPKEWTIDTKNLFFYHCSKKGSYSARNHGIKKSSHEILAFTDSDCILDKDYLIEIQRFYQKPENSKKLMAGSVRVEPENKNNKESIFESYDCILGLPQKKYVSRGYAVTANLVIPKKIFDAIGGFDETHFSGGDAEICRRAQSNGFSLVYNPSVIVEHPARREYSDFKKKINRVTGAQVSRCSFLGKIRILLSIFASPPFSFLEIFLSKHSKSRKLKASLAVPIIFMTRFYYFFYHLQPSASKQR